ncbi:MAG: Hsp20/alpha crystallin family protein [Flavobacteriales bacterium]
MTIAKYRPQATFVAPINDLVNEFFGPAFGRHAHIGHFLGHDDARGTVPSVNILDREKDFELKMLVPGFSKQDLKLNVERDVLTISAEKKVEERKENERFTRREFTHSAFSRSFKLPETVNVEAIKADYSDGVLTVTIPKAEVAKPKSHEIAIG